MVVTRARGSVAAALGAVVALGTAVAAGPVQAGTSDAAVGAAPAAAATATRITDVNGDGLADIVYRGTRRAHPENPDDDTEIGYVSVLYGGSRLPRQEILARDLKDSESEGSFASSIVTGDLDRDGFADIVLSDPVSWDAKRDRTVGKVWVLRGAASGISATRSRLLYSGPVATGRSLAFVPTPVPVLAIGGKERRGGSLHLFAVRTNGTLGASRMVSLATAGIAGPVVTGSDFGFPLSASRSLLVVGAPSATVAGVKKAGAAYVLRLGRGLSFHAVRLSQAGRGVPGAPERGDEFGGAVSVHQGYVAVGAPAESIGTATRAGQVHAWRVTGTGRTLAARHLRTATQSSLGIPGFTTGRAHWWGSSVAVYRPCAGAVGVLTVGRPNVRSSARLPLTLAGSCPAALVATEAYVPHHIGILRTSQNGTSAESTEFTVEGGILVTVPDGSSVLWPTPTGGGQPAPPAA